MLAAFLRCIGHLKAPGAWYSLSVSVQWLGSLVENLEIFVVRVNAALIASGGFAGNAEFGQVFEGRGHGRHAEFQFFAGTGNREDRLRLEQPMNA